MKLNCLCIAALPGALFGTATSAVVAEETNHWSFDVVPYFWVASVEAKTSLPSTPPGVDRFDTRIAGGGYRITDWCSATLGYRYLHEEYSRNRFNFNLDAHGFLLGFGFHF